MEGLLLRKRFNLLGGLQLGRDVRSLSKHFARWHDAAAERAGESGELLGGGNSSGVAAPPGGGNAVEGPRNVRDVFKRLLQVAAVLGVDRPAEALDYCRATSQHQGSSGGLSKADVRKALSLRCDFDPAEKDKALEALQ